MPQSSPWNSAEPVAAPGGLVAVVGPSGAGKDTLLDVARRELAGDPRFVFARRLITRPAMPDAEDHDSCSPAEFEALRERGAFALVWQAHGLSYGIPRAALAPVAEGRVVLVNLSRAVLGAAEQLAPRVAVLNITAPVEVLARRLAARGRESEAEIHGRLRREAPLAVGRARLVTIVNDRTVAEGVADLLAALHDFSRG